MRWPEGQRPTPQPDVETLDPEVAIHPILPSLPLPSTEEESTEQLTRAGVYIWTNNKADKYCAPTHRSFSTSVKKDNHQSVFKDEFSHLPPSRESPPGILVGL